MLERRAHEQVLDDARRAQPRTGRAARGDGGDPQPRRGGLAERADVDDVAVDVVGGQRRGRRAVDGQVAGPVVLDEERARPRGDRDHLGAARRRQVGAVRIRVQRLQVDDACPGPLERLGQQLRADAVGVARHGQWRQSGGADPRQRAAVGRRLDEHRPAPASARGLVTAVARRERAHGGDERGLPAGADDDVVGGEAAARLAREPRPQRGDALDRGALPRAGPAAGAREGGRERRRRLQRRIEVAGAERQRALGRQRQQLHQPVGPGAGAAEGDLLPAEVRMPVARRRRGDERPAPRPRRDQALGRQPGDRALDRHGRCAVHAHELAHRRQAGALGQGRGEAAQGDGDPVGRHLRYSKSWRVRVTLPFR